MLSPRYNVLISPHLNKVQEREFFSHKKLQSIYAINFIYKYKISNENNCLFAIVQYISAYIYLASVYYCFCARV